MTTTITATTELEAINSMLEAIGADPVSDVNTTVDSDVIHAVSILSETSREVQSQGWDFNTDTEFKINRTVDNEYLVPTNVIDIDVSDKFQGVNGVFRNGKLWDKDNKSFAWTRDVSFDVTWLFPFDQLPQTARHYIAMKAARKFQSRMLGSGQLEKYTEQDELDAKVIFTDAEFFLPTTTFSPATPLSIGRCTDGPSLWLRQQPRQRRVAAAPVAAPAVARRCAGELYVVPRGRLASPPAD